MKRVTGRLLMVLATLVVFAVGCGSDAETATAGVDSSATVTDGSATPWPGAHDAPPDEAPGESPSGPDLGLLGQGSLEGQDVVIWFWAEW